jgi:hypothetical protein
LVGTIAWGRRRAKQPEIEGPIALQQRRAPRESAKSVALQFDSPVAAPN